MFVDLPWDADAFRTSIDDFEALADRTAWPAWFLENHDKPRLASRFGPAAARAAAVMLYALRGTPFVYQGQELGLPDAEIPPDRVVDVDGRDPVRTPMPWAPGPGAGFTEGEPWLPADDSLNAAAQAGDPRSSLTLFRRLAALRRELPALQSGTQRTVEAGPDVLAWLRDERDPRRGQLLRRAAGARAARDGARLERPGPGRGRARAVRGGHREAR